MNNDAIQEDVLHELSCDPRMTSSHIAVTVKEAVVALSGFVPNYWEKLEAEKAVKPVRGPRGVANHLLRLTDSTGMLQHATFTIPNYRHGYCRDDNQDDCWASDEGI
jgi:BON domain